MPQHKFSAKDLCPDYHVAHKIPGRLRLKAGHGPAGHSSVSGKELAAFLNKLPGNVSVVISKATGSVLLCVENRASASSAGLMRHKSAPNPIPGKLTSYVFPRLARYAHALVKSVPYVLRGLSTLLFKREMNLDVLDAAALLVCILKRDFRALSSIVFFFALGEFLADWTRNKSHVSLAESLALNIENVWIITDGAEISIPLASLRSGHVLVVRAGHVIPADGKVLEGEGMINQSSLTGESMPVPRKSGHSVYAGTVLEQGELHIEVTGAGDESRISSILRGIDESEAAKASIQGKYEKVADSIVPYNFLLSGLVYALTRNAAKASSVLLVDYSCAIRLATPLTILAALQEAASYGVLIKGGKFAEALALADVVVMDKTGTITEAQPKVVEVIPFGQYSREYVLKLAACLEEHFPHPVGQAVVTAAEEENLSHREEHAKVELIVAHGIASRLHDKRVLLGSEHFLLEDSGIGISPEQQFVADRQAAQGRTILYLAVEDALAGIIMIEDKIRANAAQVVKALKADGVKRVIMLTGDNRATASNIAAQAGITEFEAELLPEQKASIVARLREQGHTVLMLGDGINDSSAISAANVGAAMCSGADMTKELADVVLTRGNLADLLIVRSICRGMLERINKNLRLSVVWNSVFLLGGILGFLSPSLSAFFHNASTSVIAARGMLPILPQAAKDQSAGTLSITGRNLCREGLPDPDSLFFDDAPAARHSA